MSYRPIYIVLSIYGAYLEHTYMPICSSGAKVFIYFINLKRFQNKLALIESVSLFDICRLLESILTVVL